MKSILLAILISLPFLSLAQSEEITEIQQQVDSLLDAGEKSARFGQPEQVLAIAGQAIELVESRLGKKDERYAACLRLFGLYHLVTGDYQASDSLFTQVKTLQEKNGRTGNEGYAKTLNYLGHANWRLGNYERAEEYYLDANEMWKRLFGAGHLNYAGGLNNLGILYMELGRLEAAALLLEKAYEIRKMTLGEKAPETAASLGNLGILYKRLGNFEEAEKKYLQAKEIWEQTVGKEHISYIREVEHLGLLYMYLGVFDQAESYLKEAKNLQFKVNGKDNPDYANVIASLGLLYLSTENYESAERQFKEAETIWLKALGDKHPRYGAILGNLGLLYLKSRKYALAEQYLLASRAIWLDRFGKKSSDYALNTNNVGNLYEKMGKVEAAEEYLIEANKIALEVNGFWHPSVEIIQSGLSGFYWRQQAFAAAAHFLANSVRVQNYLITESSKYLSEKELYSNILQYQEKQDRLFSFVFSSGTAYIAADSLARLHAQCYDNALLHKGFLLNASLKVRNLSSFDTTAIAAYHSLLSYRRRLAREYSKPTAERQNIAELEEKANALEKELARTVAGFGQAIRQVEWQEVRDALQPGEAAVEFIHYDYYTPDPTDSILYAALVLRPGNDSPHFIPLFEEKQLQALFQEHPRDRKAYLNQLYGNGKNAGKLYRLIWQPLEELLQGASTIYASPSGLLHRLNLGAVMTDGQYAFADKYQLSTIGSTRQLVVQGNSQFAVRDSPITATLYGGIRYDFDSTAIAQSTPARIDTGLLSGGELSFNYLERSVPERGRSWDFLPGTAKEADEIRALIAKQEGEAETFKGYRATEASFKELGKDGPSPRILHLATHGYFYPDPALPGSSKGGGLAALSLPSRGLGGAFKISHHPMIRSGLILAGGNQAWRGRPVPEGWEDGVLTAYEVSQVDLRNTELVVLSACETGLGDIEGNEGVYGLQRAFKIAGADKLIMSLWAVPDAQTQKMMVLFYRYWLEVGMEIGEAFRAAQKGIREKYPEHYYWGAFVLIE